MNTSMSKLAIISTLTLALGAFAACGGDDGGEDLGGQGSASKGGQSDDDGGSSEGGSTSSSNNGTTEACGPSAINQDDACEMCIATSCTAAAIECCEHDGCLDVVFCAAENACNGIDCYAPDMCQDEIDAAGLDVATNYAQALGDCALTECEAECESKVGDGS
jgi:hypothetical protein